MTATLEPVVETAPEPALVTSTPLTPLASALTPERFAAATAVLDLRLRKPTFTAPMATREVVPATDPVDPLMLSVNKRLLDRKILKEINTLDNAFVAFVLRRSAPCSMMGPGKHVLRLELVEEVDAELQAFKEKRAELARILAWERYAPAKEEAKERLKEHYNEREYPDPAALEASFAVLAKWLTFNVPSAFEAMNKEIYEREMANTAMLLIDVGAEGRAKLRLALADFIEALADRLGSDPATGKPNKFKDSTVKNLLEFVNTLAARDLTGDAELMALAEQARALLSGVSIGDLRSDGTSRTAVLSGLTAIKATLRSMDVIPSRVRKLRDEKEV